MNSPDAVIATIFLLLAFTIAGLAQVAWLKSSVSRRFARPLDGGYRLADGRRLFGDHKTWRGLVVMVPACALVFLLLGGGRQLFGSRYANGLWDLSAVTYAALGAWTGLGFMLAELPNSFFKRRVAVAPGQAPKRAGWRACCFLIDQVDSVVGGLLFLALIVPVPLSTSLSILLIGLAVHWLFNLLLKVLGMKTRAA